MSLCRLYSIGSFGTRPGNLRWLATERCNVNFVIRAAGGRSPTRRRRSQSSRPDDDGEGDGEEFRGSVLWDSNAESIRRRSRDRSDGSDGSSQNSMGWSLPKRGWTYNSTNSGREEERSKPNENWPRQRSSSNEVEYDEEPEGEDEDEDEDEEDEEDEYSGFDMKSILQNQLFSSLRWGLPVSLVVLPWLLANPVILMIGLAAVPAVQRAVGPVVKEIWHAFLDFSGYPPPPRRKRTASFNESSSDEAEDAYSSWGDGLDNSRPYRYTKSASDVVPDGNNPAEPFPYTKVGSDFERYSQETRLSRPISRINAQQSRKAGQILDVGGWDDLEADRRRRMPVRKTGKQSKLGWKSKRREKPLLVRLLVALFPFLRNWGGWLSMLVLFPSLAIIQAMTFTEVNS